MYQFFTNIRSAIKAFRSVSRAKQTKRRMAELEPERTAKPFLPDNVRLAQEEAQTRQQERTKHWSAQPQLENYLPNPSPLAYDDSYQTPEGHKLREILLLHWVSHGPSHHRQLKDLPQKMTSLYQLDANTVQTFVTDGCLTKDQEKLQLTDKGKQLCQTYQDLWDIYQFPKQSFNLDQTFPNWQPVQAYRDLYQAEIRYLTDLADYYQETYDQALITTDYLDGKDFYHFQTNAQHQIKQAQAQADKKKDLLNKLQER